MTAATVHAHHHDRAAEQYSNQEQGAKGHAEAENRDGATDYGQACESDQPVSA